MIAVIIIWAIFLFIYVIIKYNSLVSAKKWD